MRIDLSYGVFPFGLPSAGDIRASIREVESAGFQGLWVRDHLLLHEPVLDPVSLLGVVAALTEHAAVGTAVYLPVLRNPVAVAKAFASLDVLSGGRVEFGVGVGGEYPQEFDVAGVPVRDRGAALDTALDLIRRLWRGEAVSYEGRWWPPFADVQLDVSPTQPGGPRFWIGGKSDAALSRTARLGDGWLAFFRSAQALSEQFARLDGKLHEAGRNPEDVERALILYALVTDESYLEADRAVARRFCELDFAKPWGELADRYAVVGSPDRVADEVLRFAAVGVERFLILFPVPPNRLREQTDRLAHEVMPLVVGGAT